MGRKIFPSMDPDDLHRRRNVPPGSRNYRAYVGDTQDVRRFPHVVFFDDPARAARKLTRRKFADARHKLGHPCGVPRTCSGLPSIICDFGAGKVLRVDPVTGASGVFIGPIANSGLNALTFDKAGNVYVSDSFNGVI
jgi:hypothetical protein